MRYQFPVEVHSHTVHSDGDFSVSKLVNAAINFGYKGLILTDHNSSAGYLEMAVLPKVRSGEITTLPGIEWTTYFGHMLVHDADYDVDWREATPTTIDKYMTQVHDANGLVGIAHPFDMGSPICTGCHWDYQVQDYSLVNYIEIWNSNQPQERSESILAYEFWLDKLNKGYEISCSAGRDWHRPDTVDANMGVTYLELDKEKLTKKGFKDALRKGTFYITLGPTVEFKINKKQANYFVGDRVATSDLQDGVMNICVKPTELEALKYIEFTNVYVTIWNNETLLYQSGHYDVLAEDFEEKLKLPDNLQNGYLRYEVRGDLKGTQDTPIVVGNPVYLK